MEVHEKREPEPKSREFKMWTSKTPDSDINFVHIHTHGVEDWESVNLKFECMKKFPKFKEKNPTDRQVKVVLQSHHIKKAVYNDTSKDHFCNVREVKLEIGDLKLVLGLFGPNTLPCIVKIVGIPTCVEFVKGRGKIKSVEEQKVEHPTLVECTEDHFSLLPGWIDVQVLSDDDGKSLRTEEQFVSVPACRLKKLNWYQEKFMDDLLGH